MEKTGFVPKVRCLICQLNQLKMIKEFKPISIVILNWNGVEFLRRCVPSVIRATEVFGNHCEIIVVDNGSSDGSLDYLNNNCSSIRIIALKENFGFAKGMNIGIREAKGDIVIGLNNDVIVEEDFILPLVSHFSKDGGLFAVAAKMLLWDRKTLNFGQAKINFLLGLMRIRFEDTYEAVNSFYACGAAFAVDKKKFLALGGFDEDLCYYEDVDLCWRAWRNGWRTVFEPKSIVYHKYQGTSLKIYGRYGLAVISKKNYFLFLWKNIYSQRFLWQHILFMPFWCIIALLLGRFYFIQGLLQALKSLPPFLEKRKTEKCKQRLTQVSQKTKILHVSKFYYPFIGGQETHLYILLNELKRIMDVEILTANNRFKTIIETIDGIKVYRIASLGKLFSMPLAFTLPLWLLRKKSDILHFHLPYPLAELSYLLVRPTGKLIVSYHNDIIRQRIFLPFYRYFLLKFLNKADSIIVTSENLIQSSPFLKRFKNKCRIIPHGIDVEVYGLTADIQAEFERIRKEYARPLILFVGRLVYYKGLEYLIEAMKDIEANLIIIGEGPCGERLRRLAIYHGVSNKIRWLGSIANKNLVPYYYACDVFVLPSYNNSESFGMVLLEAQACAKPVVCTDLPTGVKMVNIDQKTGLLIPPKDKASLVKSINKLLSNSTLRQRYGQYAQSRIREEFTKEIMTKKTLEAYARYMS